MRYSEGAAEIPAVPQPPTGRAPGATSSPSAGTTEATGASDPRTQLILDALEKSVSLHFVGTPLRNALQEIRRASVNSTLPEGIPMYPDWNENEYKVWLDLKDVKLKTAVRLIVGQVGFTYTLSDGLLIIAKPGSPELDSPNDGRPRPRPTP
jgi:hypothetical protein